MDAALLYDENENHFFAVNQRENMVDFLQKRMNLNGMSMGQPDVETE